MFTSFIYLIIVLVVFSAYQPPKDLMFSLTEVILLSALQIFFFFILTKIRFTRFERSIPTQNPFTLDKKFNRLSNLFCILGVLMVAIDIYFLHIPQIMNDISIFRMLPTLQAAFFIFMMMGYLSILWACTHNIRRKLYRNEVTAMEFIGQNMLFTGPLIMPWFIISTISDLINLLPIKGVQQFLTSPAGEVIYYGIIILFIAIFGPAMIQKMWLCRPIDESDVKQEIEALLKKANLTVKGILTWPIFGGSMITAGVMGVVRQFRYILVTPSLLKFLTIEEIKAVIAHEIGHAKKRHILYYLFFFSGFLILSGAILNPIYNTLLYSPAFYSFSEKIGIENDTFLSTTFSGAMIILFLLYFRFIFGFFMRNFERQADAYVYTLMPDAQSLISTFSKIASVSSQAPDKPNWHHFSIKERVDFLIACERDRGVIAAHDRKIRKGILCYAALMVLSGILYFVGFTSDMPYADITRIETALLTELEKSPDNPEILRFLGDIYYHNGRYEEAKTCYEKVIEKNPSDFSTMNNLAWLLATCNEKNVFDPEKALRLSEIAAQHDKTPEALDTLAESYFINGRIKAAIETEKKALSLEPEDTAHFKSQLDKFRTAEENHR